MPCAGRRRRGMSMESGGSTTDSVFRVSDLPADLSLCILRHLEAWELVAACLASPAWAALAQSVELWRHACEYRWPHIFGFRQCPGPHDGSLDHGGTPPLAMPSWIRKDLPASVFHFDLPHPQLMWPPAQGDLLWRWRAYYLEHDVYEAMNEAPHWLRPAELEELYDHLRSALRWCSPLLHSAATELAEPVMLLGACRHLKHLSMAHASRVRLTPIQPDYSAPETLSALAAEGHGSFGAASPVLLAAQSQHLCSRAS